MTSLDVRPLGEEMRHQCEELLLAVRTFPPLPLPVFSEEVRQQCRSGDLTVTTEIAGVGNIGTALSLVTAELGFLYEGKVTEDTVKERLGPAVTGPQVRGELGQVSVAALTTLRATQLRSGLAQNHRGLSPQVGAPQLAQSDIYTIVKIFH